MVPIVVDPFAEQLVDAQRPDLGMEAGAGQVFRTEPAHETHRVGTDRLELGGQLRARAEVIASRLGDGRWVPALESDRTARIAGQDRPDPAGEATTLRLDEVAGALVRAPLPGFRTPAASVAEGEQLGDDGRARRGQEIGDAVRAERNDATHVSRASAAAGAAAAGAGVAAATGPSSTVSWSFSTSQHAAD